MSIVIGLSVVVLFFILINSGWWQNVRIDSAFDKYKAKKKSEHRDQAYHLFCTKKWGAELAQINRRITKEFNALYGGPLKVDQKVKAQLSRESADIVSKLKIFSKNYKTELEKLYTFEAAGIEVLKALRSCVREEQLKIKAALSDTHNAINAEKENISVAQSHIEAWYAKSERSGWRGGNKGNSIPKHSLFGQSYGDLDGYKSDRSSAYNEKERLKEELTTLNGDMTACWTPVKEKENQITEVKNSVAVLKVEREVWNKLKREGYSKASLASRFEQVDLDIKARQKSIYDLQAHIDLYVGNKSEEYGASVIKRNIFEIETERKSFMASFYNQENIQRLQREHRHEWLSVNGKKK